MWKMRNAHCRTKSLKKVKNEKCTLQDLDYRKKTEKREKLEMHTLVPVIWRVKLRKGGK